MIPTSDIVSGGIPSGWRSVPFWSLFRREKKTGYAEEELLSVYRDHGVIPKSSRDDNHNKPSEDLSGYQLVTEGALVTNKMKAWQGSIAISRYQGIVSPAYYVYTPQSDECDQFLHYLLRSDPYIGLYGRISKGVRVNQWDLEHEALRNIPVLLPDLATQRPIADFLDRETARIDLLIEKKQRLVALLGEKARSVINQATTIGFRESETQDSGEKWLGKVAAHWRVSPMKWFIRLQSGYAFKADRFGDVGTRLVRMNNLKRGALDLEEAVCIADEDVNISVMLRAGDILLGMSGSIGETGSLGNFAVVMEDDLPCLLNQRVGRFQFVGDELLSDYLKLVIQSASFLDPIFLAATSTAQFNVSPSQVGAIMFALPPLIEQRELVQEVARRNVGFNRARERSLVSIDRLKEYRSALITAAVTGQIDVATYAKSGTPDRRLDTIQEEMGV
ncbi:restriction endonuclease subunit S [Salipiger aestuarii]|uniref:restriction endonuclease subunit S n=1 Tax=Salipiger aestuarii TaxID=568098 RepID=UPI001CC2941E|nr:restriction endonuclease subunit S [Salipiger aestuarii]